MELIKVGHDLINFKNVCFVERHYTGYSISRREEYAKFYLHFGFIGGATKDILFDSRDGLEIAFSTLPQ